MNKKPRRGFTLVELSIYSSLLSMLLLCVYGVFVASMRYFTVSNTASDLQNSAQKAVMRMVTDISESTLSSLKIQNNTSGPSGIIFLSARTNDGNFAMTQNGEVLWQKWVCYYWDPTNGTIVRKTQSFNPTTIPPTNNLSVSTFQALAGGLVVAPITTQPKVKCTAFSITGTGPITVNATFQATDYSNASNTPDSSLNIVDTFNVRN